MKILTILQSKKKPNQPQQAQQGHMYVLKKSSDLKEQMKTKVLGNKRILTTNMKATK